MGIIQGILYLIVFISGAFCMFKVCEFFYRRSYEPPRRPLPPRNRRPQHAEQPQDNDSIFFTEEDMEAVRNGYRVFKGR